MGDCNSTSNCNPCGPEFNAFNQLASKAAVYARQANTYAIDAINKWNEFNALYLGAFATPPSTDNQGQTLQVGALYWNTALNSLYAWSGTAWVIAAGFNEFTNFLATGAVNPFNLVTRFEEIDKVKDFPSFDFSLPFTAPIPATSLVTGNQYEITSVGSTNWTAIGASTSAVGVKFTKNATPAIGTGTARVVRDLITRFSDVANVRDFGAVGDNVTDDSAAFNAAIAASRTIIVPSGVYRIKDVNLSGGKTMIAYGAYFRDLPGATYMFKLTDYSSRLVGAYISNASNCSQAAIVIGGSMACQLESIRIVAATTAIDLVGTGPGDDACRRAQLSDIFISDFSDKGIKIGSNTIDASIVDTFIVAGGVQSPADPSKRIPTPNTFGVHIDTQSPVPSTAGTGGHTLQNVVVLTTQTGIYVNQTNFVKCTNCGFDSISGSGAHIVGDSNTIEFIGTIFGSCGRGIFLEDTVSRFFSASLRTLFNGDIPPWGGPDFYTSSGLVAIGYDVYVQDTAQGVIDSASWVSDKLLGGIPDKYIFIASTADFEFTGGIFLPLNSSTTVAAGSTVYLGVNGQSATEVGQQILIPFNCLAVGLQFDCPNTPAAGETFTYTLRDSGVDTAMTAQTIGTSQTSVLTGNFVTLQKGDVVSVKLVTSAGASVTTHRGYLHLINNLK